MSSNYIDVGVYLGGSSLVIAYGKPGESADKVSVIVNEAGDRSTPAVVAINASEFSVGLPAKQNLIRNSVNTIQYAKHMIGKTLDQIDPHFVNKLDCPIKDLVVTKSGPQQPQVAFLVNKDDKPYELSLCEAIEKQLGYLNDLAKTSQNVKDCNAVLSVPLYFTASNIVYLRSCAQKAGFNVLRIIKNPIAACLAYDLEDDNSVDSNLLVYQMGGNSIEVTLVSLNNGLYRCLDSIHVLNMGGDQFTDIVVDILCEEFQKKHKSDPKTNKRSLSKLESNAEDLKHILSTMERAHCSIDALYDGIDFDYHITRQRFEGACNKIYGQVLEPVDTLLKRNNLAEAQINQVIICGAATKMCKLQALIKSKFNEAKLLNYQSADEVIALGCAKQCRIMSSSKAPPTKTSLEQDSLFKCLSCPMYLKIGNNAEITPIFKKNTPLPLKRTVNVEFDVSAPFISILESESNCLAKINLSSFKTKDINLMIQIKLNETIEITVIENATNERITIFLNSETNIEA